MKPFPVLVFAALTLSASAQEPQKPAPPFVTQPTPLGTIPAKDRMPTPPYPPAIIETPKEKTPAPTAPPDAAPAPATATMPEEKPRHTSTPAVTNPVLISTEIGGRDLQFLQNAAEVGRLQGWLGEQAKSKAETEQIKAVGDALQESQAEEIKLLASLAARKRVSVGATPANLSRQRQVAVELGKLKGPKFEKVVMEQIVAVGQEMVALYESAARSKDAEIKRFAEQVLPLAKDKLQLASRMSGSATRSSATPSFRSSEPAAAVQ